MAKRSLKNNFHLLLVSHLINVDVFGLKTKSGSQVNETKKLSVIKEHLFVKEKQEKIAVNKKNNVRLVINQVLL